VAVRLPTLPANRFSLLPQADVMKPLSIEHLMDNDVQTLSGGG
jgi:translation initiation factor RLI1